MIKARNLNEYIASQAKFDSIDSYEGDAITKSKAMYLACGENASLEIVQSLIKHGVDVNFSIEKINMVHTSSFCSPRRST